MYRILVVDDYATNGIMVKQALQAGKYEVKTVISGAQALSHLNTGNAVDLILLDINMPEMDGIETLKEIRKISDYKEIPILFLTGQADRQKVIEGFQNGIDDVISKPIIPSIINDRIERALRGMSPVQQHRTKQKAEGNDMGSLSSLYNSLVGDFMKSVDDKKTGSDKNILSAAKGVVKNTKKPEQTAKKPSAAAGASAQDKPGEEAKPEGSEFGIDFSSILGGEKLW